MNNQGKDTASLADELGKILGAQGVKAGERMPTFAEQDRSLMTPVQRIAGNVYNAAQGQTSGVMEVFASIPEAAGQAVEMVTGDGKPDPETIKIATRRQELGLPLSDSDQAALEWKPNFLRRGAGGMRNLVSYDERMLGRDGQPMVEPGIGTSIAQGAGSAIGFMALGAGASGVAGKVGRGLSAAGQMDTIGALGSVVEAQSMYRQAEHQGASKAQKIGAFLTGAAAGWTERYGASSALARLDTKTGGGLLKALMAPTLTRTAILEGTEEAGQEMLQNVMEEASRKYLLKYGPDEDWKQIIQTALVDNALPAFVVGGLFGGMAHFDSKSKHAKAVKEMVSQIGGENLAGAQEFSDPRATANFNDPYLEADLEASRKARPVTDPGSAVDAFKASNVKALGEDSEEIAHLRDAPVRTLGEASGGSEVSSEETTLGGIVTLLRDSGAKIPDILIVDSASALPLRGASVGGHIVLDGSQTAEVLKGVIFHEAFHHVVPRGSAAFKEVAKQAQESFPALAEALRATYLHRHSVTLGEYLGKGLSAEERKALEFEEAFALGAELMPDLVEAVLAGGGFDLTELQRDRSLMEKIRDFLVWSLRKASLGKIDWKGSSQTELERRILSLSGKVPSSEATAEERAYFANALAAAYENGGKEMATMAVESVDAQEAGPEGAGMAPEDAALLLGIDMDEFEGDVASEPEKAAKVDSPAPKVDKPKAEPKPAVSEREAVPAPDRLGALYKRLRRGIHEADEGKGTRMDRWSRAVAERTIALSEVLPEEFDYVDVYAMRQNEEWMVANALVDRDPGHELHPRLHKRVTERSKEIAELIQEYRKATGWVYGPNSDTIEPWRIALFAPSKPKSEAAPAEEKSAIDLHNEIFNPSEEALAAFRERRRQAGAPAIAKLIEIDGKIDALEALANDWASRVYKSNKSRIGKDGHADDSSGWVDAGKKGGFRIDDINETRRANTLRKIEDDIQALLKERLHFVRGTPPGVKPQNDPSAYLIEEAGRSDLLESAYVKRQKAAKKKEKEDAEAARSERRLKSEANELAFENKTSFKEEYAKLRGEQPEVTVAEMPRTKPDMFGQTEERTLERRKVGGDKADQHAMFQEDTGAKGQSSLLDPEFQEPKAEPKTPAEKAPKRKYDAGNPFAEKAEKARARADRLSGLTEHESAMAASFPLGAGFGRGSEASRSKKVDASVAKAARSVEAERRASVLEAQAEAFDRGEITAQGRARDKASDERRSKAATAREKRAARIQEAKDQRGEGPRWTVTGDVWATAAGYLGGSGRALVLSKHREVVGEAIARGEPVPAEVVAEYRAEKPGKVKRKMSVAEKKAKARARARKVHDAKVVEVLASDSSSFIHWARAKGGIANAGGELTPFTKKENPAMGRGLPPGFLPLVRQKGKGMSADMFVREMIADGWFHMEVGGDHRDVEERLYADENPIDTVVRFIEENPTRAEIAGEVEVDPREEQAAAQREDAILDLMDQGMARADAEREIDAWFSIAPREGTPEFKAWFKDSKVVDAEGKPLVVYHGTRDRFAEFDELWTGKRFKSSRGFYFAGNPMRAAAYADGLANVAVGFNPENRNAKPLVPGGNTMAVYLSVQNPKILRHTSSMRVSEQALDAENGKVVADARQEGRDGVIVYDLEGRVDLAVAFSPEQIKSATGNVGAYGQRPVTAAEAKRLGMTAEEANAAQAQGDIRFSIAPREWTPEFKAADAGLKARGFTVERNKGGSRYYQRRDVQVRVSDHDVPMTAEREHNAGQGRQTWALGGWNLVLDEDASAQTVAEFLARLDADHPPSEEDSAGSRRKAKSLVRRAKKVGVENVYTPDGSLWYPGVDRHLARPNSWRRFPPGGSHYDALMAEVERLEAVEPRFSIAPKNPNETINIDMTMGSHVESVLADNLIHVRNVLGKLEVPEGGDFDREEVRSWGILGEQIHKFEADFVTPLMEALKDGDISVDEAHLYLAALTSLERNKTLMGRDAELREKLKAWNESKSKLAEWKRNKSKWDKWNQDKADGKNLRRARPEKPGKAPAVLPKPKGEVGDFSAERNPGGWLRESEAKAVLEAAREGGKAKAFRKLRQLNRAMHEAKLAIIEKAGLEPPEVLKATRALGWKDYSPMKTVWQGHVGIGRPRGFSVGGKTISRMGGRRTEPDNVLVVGVSDFISVLQRAEKNRLMNVFARAVRANPDPSLWEIVDGSLSSVSMTGQDAIEAGEEPNIYRALWDARIPKGMASIAFMDGGIEKYVVFHPRGKHLAEALDGSNLISIGRALGPFAKINRYYAAANTSFSLNFIVDNFRRDSLLAGIRIAVDESPGTAARILAATPGAVMEIMRGRDKITPKLQAYYDSGAKTGFFYGGDVAHTRKQIENQLKRAREAAGPIDRTARAFSAIAGVVHHVNDAVENGVRYAYWSHLVENGMSHEDAAVKAKELTINFNKKGRIAPLLGPLYLFFNASMRGSVVVKDMVKEHPAKVVGGLFAYGVLTDLLNYLLAGDNDDGENSWDARPEYEKDRYVMLPDGNGGVFKVWSMPYGLNAIPSAGRHFSAMLRGAETKGEALAGTLASALDAFNPLGGGGSDPLDSAVHMMTPTALDPLADVALNDNFAGRPIYPGYDSGKSDSHTAWPSTGPVWTEAAQAINSLTGGDRLEPGLIDPHPETLRHLWKQIGGGVWRDATHMADAISSLSEGEFVDAIDFAPITSKFHSSEFEGQWRSAYYENIYAIQDARTRVEALGGDDSGELRSATSEESALAGLDGYRKKITKVVKKFNAAIAEEGDAKKAEDLHLELVDLVREFNRDVSRTRKEAKDL